MLDHLSGIFFRYEGNSQFVCVNAVYIPGICFVKARISIDFVKIIHTERIIRTFVFDDIILFKNPSDIFLHGPVRLFFDDQHINFHRFRPQLMLVFKYQVVCVFFQFDLDSGKKCGMPIRRIRFFFLQLHRKPPYSVFFRRFSASFSENLLLIWIKARIF